MPGMNDKPLAGSADEHFGIGDSRDDRSSEDRDRWCETMPKCNIVLLNDLADFTRYGRRVLAYNKRIWRRIEAQAEAGFKVYLCDSNHLPLDIVREAFTTSSPNLVLCSWAIVNGWYLCHGDSPFDEITSGMLKPVGDAAQWLGNVAGRISAPLEDWLSRVGGRIHGTGRFGDPQTHARLALDWIADVPNVTRGALCGHTHIAGSMGDLRTGKIYRNLGCLERGRPIWTQL